MAKKTQGTESKQEEAFDLSQFLGGDEIERPGEDADFGNEIGTSDSDNSPQTNSDQYDTEGLDDVGYPEKDEPDTAEDDSEQEEDDDQDGDDESDTEAESDAETEPEADGEEQDEEAVAAEDSQAEDVKSRKDPTIPKRRLDSEIAKRRQVEKELKELRREQQEMQQQIKEKEKVPEETIQQWLQDSAQKALDGETEESAKLQQKAFDAMSSNRGEAQAQQQDIDPQELVQQVEERVELKNTVKDVFDAYPQLDPNNDQFDDTLNEEVLELNDFYVSKGYTQSVAVEKAVEVLSSQHGLQPANAEPQKQQKKPARDTKPDVKKKMEVADKQPSEPTSRRGNKKKSEDTVDVTSLSDDEFMALPDNVRARLRGD